MAALPRHELVTFVNWSWVVSRSKVLHLSALARRSRKRELALAAGDETRF
jgi:hypothetical protein